MTDTGVYKITSPSGRVYIGQSYYLYKRINSHQNKSANTFLGSSIKKHGKSAHMYDIVHNLPFDVSQEVIDIYEQLYIDLYRSAGVSLMNIKEAGSRGKLPLETKERVSKGLTGKKQSPETILKRKTTIANLPAEKVLEIRKKCGDAARKYFSSPESSVTKIKIINNLKSRSGRIVSAETKEKIRQARIGTYASVESIAKRSESLKKHWDSLTPEQREKRKTTGRKNTECSQETRDKISQTLKKRHLEKL